MTISLVYNLDSRPKFLNEMTTTADCDGGCRCVDFFTHGLLNKINFLAPHELEVIVYIDVHEPIPEETLEFLEQMKRDGRIHQLIMNPHIAERSGIEYGKKNNDLIYAESLSMATGDYVVHFDSDIVAYKKSGFDVCTKYFELLEQYAYVSIPSLFSPYCVDINSQIWKHLDYMWASTRFVICKRKTLPSLDEMLRCFDNKYLNKKYGMFAKPNCVEHILGLIAGSGNVYYPPLNLSNYLIVSWMSYYRGVIEKLNTMPYDKIYDYFINKCGGIYGANDVCCKPLGKLNE